ncbi:MAG: hypothetical protein R3Y32_03365 [Bacillota bacterium]
MKKGVSIQLDKIRMLRYGINALVIVEELTGRAITKLDLKNISIKDLRTIVYAGLSHEDKDLTPESVGEIIDTYSDITYVAEKVGEAFSLAFGKGDKTAPKK